MRISEKTIELNFSSKLNYHLNNKIIWFGLTQKEEAKQGFDISCKLKTRMYFFQIKATKKVLKSGVRQFTTPHHQLDALFKLSRLSPYSVFYVLPDFGNTSELIKLSTLDNYWLLDINQISSISAPTSKGGKLRKSSLHYINMKAPYAIIHSEPIEVNLTSLGSFSNDNDSSGLTSIMFQDNFERFWDIIKPLSKRIKFGIMET